MSTYYLSKERIEELKEELKDLTTNKRMEVAEKLKRAKEFGDLSENSEYNEAKDEQARLERRIMEVEDVLKNSELIKKSAKGEIVEIGSAVTVEKNGKEKINYIIVGSQEANPDEGKISNESLVGGALLGKAVGETVEVKTLNGENSYKIISIE
ncbi:MAG: transcription elongation factor GreA [Candidatus Pacebacteria bacterium]|nr:transcription elongation factor GreA [Candidatus Paceibacterota bacterium]